MRVSKQPEERKQEIIRTAMKLFETYGYESIKVTDITKEMNVVSGLFYRYFTSKEELYNVALDQYAEQCSKPFIHIMEEHMENYEDYQSKFIELFQQTDGKELYHSFFHKQGNQMLHKQLELKMIDKIMPFMIQFLQSLKDQGFIHIEDARITALILIHGQMPIINDELLPTEQKIKILLDFINKILNIEYRGKGD